MPTSFPAEGMELTHILVVADIERARTFYRDVLGAEVYREYGGSSCVLRAFGTWLLLVTGGGPTADKPSVTFAPPADPETVSHSMTIRVPDCRAAHALLESRGAAFLDAAGRVGLGDPSVLPGPGRPPARDQRGEGPRLAGPRHGRAGGGAGPTPAPAPPLVS